MTRVDRARGPTEERQRTGTAIDAPSGGAGGAPVDLSVVVPCLNGAETVGDLLTSLAGQAWGGRWEVVFADNGSTDDSAAVAERFRDRLPALRVVDASERRGQPFACNQGAREARGASVVFVDVDDVPAPGWLPAMGEALRRHEFVASRHEFRRLSADGEAAIRDGVQTEGLQRLWYPPYLPHAGGCGLGIRRRLYLAVGGLDEDLPVLHDTDLCIRVQRLGVELAFEEKATIHVRCRSTASGTFRQARRWASHNVLLYRRHRGDERLEEAWSRYLADWKRLLLRLRRPRGLLDPARRRSLAWMLGWQLGMLEGAIRHRVPPVPKRGQAGGERDDDRQGAGSRPRSTTVRS